MDNTSKSFSTATNPADCPICAKPLPADAPSGICPSCLIQQTLRSGDAPKAAAGVELEHLAAAFPLLQIEELIGVGGMGRVYRARQPHLGRVVALKVLAANLADDPEWLERFNREARALAKLSHPNIVQVFDFGERPMPFLLMEYVEGVNLRQAMEHGRLSANEALVIVPKLCDALHYAHENGVLHRDIKPENILIDSHGRVKLVDFGLAKLRDEAAMQFTLTQSGAKLGTVAYMAPEQIESPADVDHRADIYSLGVVLYEMLTGGLPLGRFPAPSESSGVDARLDGVVFRTLEKQRDKRFQRADEVKTGIEAATTGMVPMPKRTIQVSPLAAAVVAGVFVAVAAGFVWMKSNSAEAVRQSALAREKEALFRLSTVPALAQENDTAVAEARIAKQKQEAERAAEANPQKLAEAWLAKASRTDSIAVRDEGVRAIKDALNSSDPLMRRAALAVIPRLGDIKLDRTAFREGARKLLAADDPKIRGIAISALVAAEPEPADEARILEMVSGAAAEDIVALTFAIAEFAKRDYSGKYGPVMLSLIEKGIRLAQESMNGSRGERVDSRMVLNPLWGAKFSPEIEAKIIEWTRSTEPGNDSGLMYASNSSIPYNAFYYALSTQGNKSAASVKRLIELAQHPDTVNIGGRCLWGMRGSIPEKADQAAAVAGVIALLENRNDGYQWREGLDLLKMYATREHLPALEKLVTLEALPEHNAKSLKEIIAKLRPPQ